jgi:DNA-binding HxlR family transcriptional regulator
VGKKWSIEIIKDLFFGMHHFNEFLDANPNLSAKVLSQRLKEMEKNRLVTKTVVSVTPLSIEYHLTGRGRALNRVIYEMAIFAMTACECDVPAQGGKDKKEQFRQATESLRSVLGIAE